MKSLKLPLSDVDIKKLEVGELVYLSGEIYTARDAAHKRMFEEKSIPFDADGAVVYYVGPTPAPKGKVIGSCGPTTSSRMDAFTPYILSKGVKGMIGKGKRNMDVISACKKYNSVYFIAPGGCGALLAKCVVGVSDIAYPDLFSEAICRLTVKDFPVVVGIDSKGNSLYK